MKLLENKVAIVTGAGSGIGRNVALTYAAEGAKVVVGDIQESGGKETVGLIKENSGEALFVKADSSKPADNEMLVRIATEQYGSLHIACNNAGISGPGGPTESIRSRAGTGSLASIFPAFSTECDTRFPPC